MTVKQEAVVRLAAIDAEIVKINGNGQNAPDNQARLNQLQNERLTVQNTVNNNAG